MKVVIASLSACWMSVITPDIALAQSALLGRLALGVKTGVQVTRFFPNPPEPYLSTLPYEERGSKTLVGPAFEVWVPWVAIEVSALRKRFGYYSEGRAMSPSSGFYEDRTTTMSARSWEFPMVARRSMFTRGKVSIDASLGYVFRTTTATSEFHGTRVRSFFEPTPVSFSGTERPLEFQEERSHGATVGAGLTFKRGLLKIKPELRYTRWNNEPFKSGPQFRSNRNTLDLTVGVMLGSQ
jgi:hypothetical protein